MNRREISEIKSTQNTKIEIEIYSNYDSKLKSKAIIKTIRMKHDP